MHSFMTFDPDDDKEPVIMSTAIATGPEFPEVSNKGTRQRGNHQAHEARYIIGRHRTKDCASSMCSGRGHEWIGECGCRRPLQCTKNSENSPMNREATIKTHLIIMITPNDSSRAKRAPSPCPPPESNTPPFRSRVPGHCPLRPNVQPS